MIWRGAKLGDPPALSLPGLALAAAARAPAAPALIDAPTGAITTCGELADRLLRVASSLSAMGLGRGDVVATLTPNTSHWVTFSLGAMAAGAAVTGINPLLRPQEIARQIAVSGATLLAVAARLAPMLEDAGLSQRVKHVVTLHGEADGSDLTLAGLVGGGRPESRSPDPDDIALLPFSSGSSGMPKAVEVTGRSIALAGESAAEALGLSNADVWLNVAPFFHVVAIATLAGALARGAPVVIAPQPEAEPVLAAIERYRVTATVVTPPLLRALAAHPDLAHRDLGSLRAVGCTAAPLSAEMESTAAQRLGATIFQAYGMSETIGAITLGPLSAPRPGSCGRLAPGSEARIIDPESGVELGDCARGEVWVRAPYLMRGYRDCPEATAEAMTRDGWLRTGDIGAFDADGYLFIVDRLKDLIKVGAAQVAPAELEALLVTHPDVRDAAVVGQPSPKTGEAPVACVVAAAPIDPEALMRWVAERVAPFKQLQGVVFVEAIPRQPNGKIMRRLLAAKACESAATASAPSASSPSTGRVGSASRPSREIQREESS